MNSLVFSSDFENKLSAMGFDVTPSKTATLDLTPIKNKEKQQKSPVKPVGKTVRMEVEEKKITTTR